MKNGVGILYIKDDYEENSQLDFLDKKIFDEQNISVIEVKGKKQIETLDGLVIFLKKSSDSVKVFQLLIELNESIPLFIWILSKEKDVELNKLFLHLSKNSIIDIMASQEECEELGIKIKNSLNYKKKLLKSIESTELSSDRFLDFRKQSLVVDDKTIELTGKEFKVFDLLYENVGNLVLYDEINSAVYGNSTEKSLEKYRISNIIFHIRNKLKEQKYFKIKTIRTKGYMLTYL